MGKDKKDNAKDYKSILNRRLKAYSAMAAGTLLLAPSAEAAVQWSGPQNLVVDSSNNPVMIDLNNDGIDDFAINYYYVHNTWYGLSIYPLTNGGLGGDAVIVTDTIGYMSAANLSTNYIIQNTLPYYFWTKEWNRLAGSHDDTFGNFYDSSGCIGVRFNTQGGERYGWIGFSATEGYQGTITDWAYEDTGASIKACDRGEAPPQAVPTLNQWGLIALAGFLAMAAYRALRKLEQEG